MVEAALTPGMGRVGRKVSVVALSNVMRDRLRGLASGALLASALVTVVCWMNIFSMATTWGLYRRRELITRTALGASPSRILALFMGEGARVAVFGWALALLVTSLSLALAVRTLPAQFTTLGMPTMSGRIALATAVVAVVAWLCWCAGATVAWRYGASPRGSQIAGRDGRAVRLTRFVMIAGQLGAASVLLSAAALLGRSYLNLNLLDAGMDGRAQILAIAHDPDLQPAVRKDVIERTAAKLRRLPGVYRAGVRMGGMLNGRLDPQLMIIDGRVANLEWVRADRDFFEALGLEFLVGGPPDAGHGGAVITESTAKAYFQGRASLGTELFPGRPVPIVGMIRDVRSIGLSVLPKAAVYEVGGPWFGSQATYVMRVIEPRWRRQEAVRTIQESDPLAVVVSAGTVSEQLGVSIRDRTFAALIVGLFASATLAVTLLGVTSVVVYTVARRSREFAVRLALGATVARMIWLAVADAVAAAAVGGVAGILGAFWSRAVLQSLVFGIAPNDRTTLLVAQPGLLGLVACAAIWPALRILRISPAAALRSE